MKRLILGSSSKWRAGVLRSRGVPFEIVSPDIDEKSIRGRDAPTLTLRIAHAKARAIVGRLRAAGRADALVITSDQVAVFHGTVREKPVDSDEARRFLASYGLDVVHTVTAVVVTDAATREFRDGVDLAAAWFGEMPLDVVESAIARGDVLNSCGAFTLDDPDIGPRVTRIQGEKESVDGLPLALTRRLLAEFDYRLP